MAPFSIGKLARQANVNIETIRYYERRGLMPRPRRRESGYREYTESDLQRLKFIKKAKLLGFSLNEILDLLTLRVDPDTTCQEVRQRAETKIRDIDTKIHELQKMRKALRKLADSCHGAGPASDCPILEALEAEGK